MKTFQTVVVYPIYITVNAESQEEAENKALENADYYLETSMVEPVIHECAEIEFDSNPNVE
jgi:hypothetical protein